ncbi:MAG: hypothetical protein ABIQ32_09835 [Sphingomicrobium sp.]
MVLLLLAAASAPSSPPVTARASAQATIRIIQPATATELDWKAARRRSDRIIQDEQGRKLRVRTIDFE